MEFRFGQLQRYPRVYSLNWKKNKKYTIKSISVSVYAYNMSKRVYIRRVAIKYVSQKSIVKNDWNSDAEKVRNRFMIIIYIYIKNNFANSSNRKN